MKWTEKYRIIAHDTDSKGIIRPSAVLRYMQETAALQLNAVGPTEEQLKSLGKAFLVTRLSMGIYADLHAYDEISVQTFPTDSRGYSFNRCARMYRGDTVVAELSTVWALADIETRKLCRVTDVPIGCDTEEAISLDVPSRINIPKDLRLSLVGERTVMYSDIDRNMHMNNTNYPDVFCDYIPSFENRRALSVSIGFFKEASFGETVKIYCGSNEEDVYFLKMVKKNGDVGAEARIVVENV